MTPDPLGSFRDQLVDGVGGEARRVRRRRAVVAGAAAALAVAAGAVAVGTGGAGDQQVHADGSTTTTTPPFTCPVTEASEPGLDPPDGFSAPPPDDVWYGTADLWTALPADGSSPVPRKSVWWSQNFPGGGEEEQPAVSVTWRRLDDPSAPVVRAEPPGTNAFTPGTGWFMIASEMDPISIGCWEVTGSYKGHELTYVYEVVPHLAVHQEPLVGGDGALVVGVVRYEAPANCYLLGDHPVVWPYGTTVSPDGRVITLTDGTEIQMGDHLSGGGGYSAFDQHVRWDISPGCFSTDREIAVFNAIGRIEVTP
jgi:hypothetical protein